MTSRNVGILAAVAIAVLGAALLLSRQSSAPEQKLPEALYPGLKEQLSQATSIRIFTAGDAQAVELTRKDSNWSVSQRSGYPANAAKAHNLLRALAEARPVEEKTSNPDNYPALGVEDVSAATATGARVEIEGPTPPVNLIIGKAAGANGAYVRRVGEAASWQINQSLEASTTPGDWLSTSVVDVSADRVQSVTVTLAGARPYTAAKTARADAEFRIDSLPKGKALDAVAVNGMAGALTALTLADVRPAKDFEGDKPAAQASVRTFDGLVLDLDGWTLDGKHYIAARAAYDEALARRFHVDEGTEGADTAAAPAPAPATTPATEKVAEVAASTNAQLTGWIYEVPDYKYEAIFKPLAEVLEK